MTRYPKILENLLTVCRNYRSGDVSLEGLQSAVGNAEDQIVAVEERELREFLMDVGGRIEELLYTASGARLDTEAERIVSEVEAQLRTCLKDHQ